MTRCRRQVEAREETLASQPQVWDNILPKLFNSCFYTVTSVCRVLSANYVTIHFTSVAETIEGPGSAGGVAKMIKCETGNVR